VGAASKIKFSWNSTRRWMRSCDRTPLMSAKEAFGSNLRRTRVQRGVSLEQIAQRTKVSIDLWEAMERNDFSRWPSGIFARAYIRAYAVAIGVDPESTVDEFCRWFPQGDRRIGDVIRGQAQIVGHPLEWKDEVPPSVKAGDRRDKKSGASRREPAEGLVGIFAAFGHVFGRLRRTFGRA
jgi:transcriptional regulator with XRE-family HTH domain